jgi:hypothetical protein
MYEEKQEIPEKQAETNRTALYESNPSEVSDPIYDSTVQIPTAAISNRAESKHQYPYPSTPTAMGVDSTE